ncbi:MAG: hypothetical protein JNM40_17055 [Myxococcales bacterium]|nr:hypothetical protein [Myxococcales bacterium]
MAESFSAEEPTPQVTDAPGAMLAVAVPQALSAEQPSSDGPTEKARARILDIARIDNEKAADSAQRERDNALRAEVVSKAVPELYLKLVDEMRAGVQLFNQSLRPPDGQSLPFITWTETPNVVLRDATSGDGMRVRIARRGATFDLLLRFASRAARADVPIIEGHGDYGIAANRTKTMLRVEGWVERGQPVFWYSLDFKRQSVKLEEVAERIVASIAANDYSLLSRDLTSDLSDAELRSDE